MSRYILAVAAIGALTTGDVAHRITQVEKTVLQGHSEGVVAIAYNPKGDTIASGSIDKTIRIWDLRTGKVRATFFGHSGTVFSLAFSPDGSTLASGGDDQTVKLWDMRTLKLKQTLVGRTGAVYSLAYSPDGATLAGAGKSGAIQLWQTRTYKMLRVLRGHEGVVYSVRFHERSRLLTSSGMDGTVRVWSMRSGESILSIQAYERMAVFAAFRPQSTTLVSVGSVASIVRDWDWKTGVPVGLALGTKKHIPYARAQLSHDGRLLALGYNSSWLEIYDLNARRCISTFQGNSFEIGCLDFSPDGGTLAEGGRNGNITIWELRNGR